MLLTKATQWCSDSHFNKQSSNNWAPMGRQRQIDDRHIDKYRDIDRDRQQIDDREKEKDI